MSSTQILLICFGIYLTLAINFFRWSKGSYDGRVGTGIFTVVGFIVLLFVSTCGTFTKQKKQLDNPEFVEYNSFGPTNYLFYRFKDKDRATFEWIGDIETEKHKKFYSVTDHNFFGGQIGDARIERY